MKKLWMSTFVLFVFVIVSFVYTVSSVNVYAQEARAAVGGLVTDQNGEAIAGATVIVTSEDTGVRQETKTNEQGRWSARFLNPGHYTITISYTGFKTAERKGLTLDTADDKTLDVTLELGSVAEQIVVVGETPLIDTTSATSGTVITPEMISEMPLLSRIPTLLAELSPGVLLLPQGQNVPRMWSVNAASDIRVDGGRDSRSNEFLIDGTPDVKSDRVAFIPPLDSVAEFRVMTNAYDAQYGRQAGGTINLSLKSGTKDYHGSLYEFNQNNVLNATPSHLTSIGKPPVHYNLYGGTIGGPVRIPKLYNGKERTFFFFTYEGTRNQDPRGNVRSVPTELERRGDFSQSFTTSGGNPTHIPIRIYDPYTPGLSPTNKARTQFTNNIIPPDMISGIAKKILEYVPLPNAPSAPTGSAVNNYIPNSTRQNKMASVVTRVDQIWNNQHKSFASVRWNHETEILDDFFNNVSTGGGPNQRINQQVGLDHIWTISPSKVLDLRYSLTRWQEPTQSHGKGFDPTTLGFSPTFVSGMVCKSFPAIRDIFGGVGGGCGDYFSTLYHTWNTSLTHIHGKMTFHYGGEFRILQEASGSFGLQSGAFRFTNQWTRQIYDSGSSAGDGSTMGSFLLGLVSDDNGTDHESRFNRNATRFDSQRYYGLYFQNDWRVTSRLTLNLGLRWDFERPFIERFNRIADDFDPTVLSSVSDTVQANYAAILQAHASDPIYQQLAQLVPASSFKVYGGQLFAGVNGHREAATGYDLHEWQPRVGFAYRFAPHTVIRGGFGRFVQGAGLKGGQNGFSAQTNTLASADAGITPWDTLAAPFRDGAGTPGGRILEPTGAALGPMTNFGSQLNWDNQDPGHPHSWQYSVHLQQEFRGWLFEIGYSHNKTYDIYWGLNQNNPSFDLWYQVNAPRFDASGKPIDRLLGNTPLDNPFKGVPGVVGSLGTSSTRNFFDFLRPFKEWGTLTRESNPWGKNQYDAMLVKVEHRFKHGFGLLGAFTWSKLFEDTSFRGPEIAGPVTEHKLGGEDRPFIFTLAPVYELPVGRGRSLGSKMPRILDAFVGGWELSGQLSLQSGTPIVFGDNNSNFFYDGEDFHLSRDQRTLNRWFDTSHFFKFPGRGDPLYDCVTGAHLFPDWTGVYNLPGANYRPAPANCGNTSADPVQNGVYNDRGNYVRSFPTRWGFARNDRENEVNVGIMKNFKPTERMKIQFRLEAFNAFNHPRFGTPNTDPASNNFGLIQPTQQNTARLVQMALKVYF